jgi:hypothetical protein
MLTRFDADLDLSRSAMLVELLQTLDRACSDEQAMSLIPTLGMGVVKCDQD